MRNFSGRDSTSKCNRTHWRISWACIAKVSPFMMATWCRSERYSWVEAPRRVYHDCPCRNSLRPDSEDTPRAGHPWPVAHNQGWPGPSHHPAMATQVPAASADNRWGTLQATAGGLRAPRVKGNRPNEPRPQAPIPRPGRGSDQRRCRACVWV